MRFITKFEKAHKKARHNIWIGWFAIFCRVVLAIGFIPPGIIKIIGERFTALPDVHPMGSYLTALFQTGYYYTAIGVAQVLAGILLLVPRTATLGALIYFPVILNITILSFSVRFDGSLLSAPLMLLANVFLLCWDYHKLKFIFPWHHKSSTKNFIVATERLKQFPWKFAVGCFITFVLVVGSIIIISQTHLMPRNSITACQQDCNNAANPESCLVFCDCVHKTGSPLNECLECYDKNL
jgi:uncharacterized membrane protein YphA (DoxX/SURF4 family)